jgi:nucleotide-binding universal stress UspA family protein
MTAKEKLLHVIEQTPEPLLTEALHYLEYLIERHLDEQEEEEDLQDLKTIREEIASEGTVPWSKVKQELGL